MASLRGIELVSADRIGELAQQTKSGACRPLGFLRGALFAKNSSSLAKRLIPSELVGAGAGGVSRPEQGANVLGRSERYCRKTRLRLRL
jgi:hypothetical protein